MDGAGLGLRQGEIFGLSPDDIDLEVAEVHVRRQVKLFGGNRHGLRSAEGPQDQRIPRPRRPGFTLWTYTHLMEGSSERTKRAIDAAFVGKPAASDEHDEDDIQ